MATLTLSFKGHRLSVFRLDDERCTVGRDPDCRLHIDSLAVAPRHLELVPSEDGYLVVALDPDHPVLVNDERVERARLEDGDLIGVGKHSLTFADDGEKVAKASAVAGADLEAARFDGARDLADACSESDAAVSHPGRERPEDEGPLFSVPAYMQIRSGSKIGRVIVFRRALNRLDRVGARGVVVARKGDSYRLLCLEEGPEIRIDGKKFDPTAPEMNLEDGSVVQIGDLRLKFFTGGAELHADAEPADIDPDSILLKDIDDF